MARKKTGEKRFAVRATLENVSLAKAGSAMTLQIASLGERLGEIQIGRGSFFWWGRIVNQEARSLVKVR